MGKRLTWDDELHKSKEYPSKYPPDPSRADEYPDPYPMIGQGPAEPATDEDIARDDLGFTHPNLHRRIEPTEAGRLLGTDVEYRDRSYKLNILNVNSYRTTTIHTHNEEADKITDVNVEIP